MLWGARAVKCLCCGAPVPWNALCHGASMLWSEPFVLWGSHVVGRLVLRGARASQAGEVSLPSSLWLLFIPREPCVPGELTESQPCMKQMSSIIVWDTVCAQNDQAGEEETPGKWDGACVQSPGGIATPAFKQRRNSVRNSLGFTIHNIYLTTYLPTHF